jgi:hypothetical protein
MDSMKGWLAIAPMAGSIARSSRRRGYTCYLLEHGLQLAQPRCAACGIEFDPPRLVGERFRVALQVFDSRMGLEVTPTTRMLVGTKVLISRAGAPLGPLLDRSITYVGARVMVASVRFRPGRYLPILMCRTCGHNVMSHLNLDSEANYAWDWIVQFRPRKLLSRLGRRLGWRQSVSFPRVHMRAITHERPAAT